MAEDPSGSEAWPIHGDGMRTVPPRHSWRVAAAVTEGYVRTVIWQPGRDDSGVDGAERELPLTSGNTARVVRVSDTVRRPLQPGSARIHRRLAHFELGGFDGVLRLLGIGSRRREILSFIDSFAPPPQRVPAQRGGRARRSEADPPGA
jgi:hypothetical protein